MGWKKSPGDHPDHPTPSPDHKSTPVRRRPAPTPRLWSVVTDAGDYDEEEFCRHQIMKRTGLPARDLRALDPLLSYPSSILGRERAIVVNLEHIKAIITATEVLLVCSASPMVGSFVEHLRHRILGGSSNMTKEGSSDGSYTQGEDGKGWNSSTTSIKGGVPRPEGGLNMGQVVSGALTGPLGPLGLNKLLPFEFKALEACLESACRCLEYETRILEKEAYPALDELTSQISTLNLERVRQIKSRLVEISGRVQRVRDELEHLLDDDQDMAEMYLTEKLRNTTDQMSIRVDQQDNEQLEFGEGREEDDSKSRISEAFTYSKPDVEELEMLLEAYFAQIDGISQQLSAMSEYVGDTEDYVNIMLDDKQNQLLQMGVSMSAANMVIGVALLVAGIFGMNIDIPVNHAEPNGLFLQTTFATLVACFFLYLFVVGWAQHRVVV